MVKKYSKGITVNEETIALKEIQEIGIQGNFLGAEHTFKHFKGTIYEPDFLVRKQRPTDFGTEQTAWGNRKKVYETNTMNST